MSMMMRYILAAFIMLGAAIFAISPFASTFIEQWSRRDVELRSTLVFNSVRDELVNLLAADASARIDDLFGRLALDGRLLAVGFCNRKGVLLYRSQTMPANFSWVLNVLSFSVLSSLAESEMISCIFLSHCFR